MTRQTLILTGVFLIVSPAVSGGAEEPAHKNFGGLQFGIGLSATWDTVDRRRVDDVVVDANGIVRANKHSNVLTRFMLESHYFFMRKPDGRFGFGPFVAIEPGSAEIINAIGAGIMIGLRRGDSPSTGSFNIGLGYGTDPNSRVLGDEFQLDRAAPLGPDGKPLPIRYVQRDQGGWLFLVSFNW